jgi:hypothetical protein
VCHYLSFVERGLLKSYIIDEKGIEHVNLFAWEGWWTFDLSSFSKKIRLFLQSMQLKILKF